MSADPAITPELIAEHGLTPEEYERIQEIVGREPNFTELGIFSVMWSEHCSYKTHVRCSRGFRWNPPGAVGAGEENAGIIDIGDDLAIRSRSRAIIIPARWSRFREPPRGRWDNPRYFHHGCAPGVRDQLPCALASWIIARFDGSSAAWSGIAHYGIASAFRPWRVRCISTRATKATRW